MAKTLAQGRKPGSGRKPGKGKTLSEGRKPGSGRRPKNSAANNVNSLGNLNHLNGLGNLGNLSSLNTLNLNLGFNGVDQNNGKLKPKRKYTRKNKQVQVPVLETKAEGSSGFLGSSVNTLQHVYKQNTVSGQSDKNEKNKLITSRDLEALDALRELTTSPTFTAFNDLSLRLNNQPNQSIPLPRLDILSQQNSTPQSNKFLTQRMMNVPKDEYNQNCTTTNPAKNLIHNHHHHQQQQMSNGVVGLPQLHPINDPLSFQNTLPTNSINMNHGNSMNLNLHATVNSNNNVSMQQYMNNRNNNTMANNQFTYNN